jgi:hypothetical protein
MVRPDQTPREAIPVRETKALTVPLLKAARPDTNPDPMVLSWVIPMDNTATRALIREAAREIMAPLMVWVLRKITVCIIQDKVPGDKAAEITAARVLMASPVRDHTAAAARPLMADPAMVTSVAATRVLTGSQARDLMASKATTVANPVPV